MTVTLHLGDCLDTLRAMPEASVDSIVTDPPYGLTFMGAGWDRDVPSTLVWAECLRVLKPGGHLLAFAGTRTQHRMATRIEDAGFEIRDLIGWLYGQGFPKSHNLSGEWEGWGSALKPSFEPVTMARKPFRGTLAACVLAHGTGALNIDGARIGTGEDRTPGGNPSRRDFTPGWGMAATERATGGRWPANLIHDGSAEVEALFPQAGAHGGGKPGASEGYHGGIPAGTNATEKSAGSAARFFYCAKASRSERGEGNTHPTVKPLALMRYLVRLVTPPGGLVLDPFAGSGTTGLAAMAEGMRAVLCELDPDHGAIIRNRIAKAQHDAGLFGQEAAE